MTAPHPLQKHINFVLEYFTTRAIPFENEPSRWGCVIQAEGIRFNFNKNTINVYRKKVQTHGDGVDWDWHDQLFAPKTDEETKAVADYIRLSCCMAHYAHYAREFTKAPEWVEFTAYTRDVEGRDGVNAIRIGVQAWVKLNRLGHTPFYKFLASNDYYVVNNSYNDHESERVAHHNFNSMTLSLGSPVGQVYVDGHAPEAHGNFLTDGPFTFIPAKEHYSITSNYVLPEIKVEPTKVWVLVRTHDVKMNVENGK